MERRTFLQAAATTAALLPFGSGRPAKAQSGLESVVYVEDKTKIGDFDPTGNHMPHDYHEVGLPYPDFNSKLAPIWQRIFPKTMGSITKVIDYENFNDTHRLDVASLLPPSVLPPTYPSREESSQNWSGGYIVARGGLMFVEVAGSFTVPAIPSNKPSSRETSIWVGLDGQRSYLNSSLPQIGITARFDGDSVDTYTAWYQWWVPEAAKPSAVYPRAINEIKPTVKDEIFCDVQAIDFSNVMLTMANLSVSPVVTWTRRLLVKPNSAGMSPKISGATAQWIVERPTKEGTADTLLQLVNYDRVKFSSCYAVAAIDPSRANAEYRTLTSPRWIRMYERGPIASPHRTVRLSWPDTRSRLQLDAFDVCYVGP